MNNKEFATAHARCQATVGGMPYYVAGYSRVSEDVVFLYDSSKPRLESIDKRIWAFTVPDDELRYGTGRHWKEILLGCGHRPGISCLSCHRNLQLDEWNRLQVGASITCPCQRNTISMVNGRLRYSYTGRLSGQVITYDIRPPNEKEVLDRTLTHMAALNLQDYSRAEQQEHLVVTRELRAARGGLK